MNKSFNQVALGPWVITALILVACLTRLVPHPPNFSPIAAVALFGGAFFSKRGLALLVPVLALVISDAVLGMTNGGLYSSHLGSVSNVIVIGAMLLTTVIGFALRDRKSSIAVIGAALVSSALFFLLTNFGAFLVDPTYPKTLAGLGAAYVAGIPFAQWTVLSTLMYSAVLFGGFQMLRSNLPMLESETV